MSKNGTNRERGRQRIKDETKRERTEKNMTEVDNTRRVKRKEEGSGQHEKEQDSQIDKEHHNPGFPKAVCSAAE